jgi:D-serine deaminase-like pyridoxal phosphate-dependent protein
LILPNKRERMADLDSGRYPIRTLEPATYFIREPGTIPTPRLLVFRRHLEGNIRRMKAHLEAIAPGSGFAHLCPHVKTHKSIWVTQRMLDAGITQFKATPNELEMLLEATDVFVAYPLLAHQAAQAARLAKSHPKATVAVQVSRPEHVAILNDLGERFGHQWDVFLDLDVGMGRTGTSMEEAVELHSIIRQTPSLRLCGVHGYDGHNHDPDNDVRSRVCRESIGRLVSTLRALESRGAAIERVIAGGSPTFQPDLAYLLEEQKVTAKVQVSPGTWIYWDSKYDGLMPGRFIIATVILAQVIDLPAARRMTLNLGHKRWAIDQGPVDVFSTPGLRVVSVSEEHTVLEAEIEHDRRVGDYVLIAPRHVCSTVNLWEYTTVIGHDGEIESASCPVDARNR